MTTADPRTAPPHPNLLRTVPYSRARAPTTWDPRHAGTTTAAPRRRRAARAPPPSSCATPARAATCARCSGCCTAATSTPTRSVRPAPHRPTPASCAAPPHTCFLCRTAPHLLPMPHRPTPASSASAASLWTLIPPLYLSLACVSDQGDYDKRTATHLAASEGRWAAVRFLLEEGGADANPLDRWGRHGPTSGRLGGAMSGHHQLLRQTGSEGLGLPSARVRGGRAPQIPPRGHVPGTSPPSTIPIHSTAPGHPGGAARRSTTRCAPSTRSSPTTCAPRAASLGKRSGAARRRRRGARVGFASGHETLSEDFVQTKFKVCLNSQCQ